jgi:hypothetical protein
MTKFWAGQGNEPDHPYMREFQSLTGLVEIIVRATRIGE